MRLSGVTITGADDQVDPKELLKLSEEFPFVEWGILFSPTRIGPRYPTEDWISHLARAASQSKARFAAHFCGGCTRDTVKGDGSWMGALHRIFDRVQLNGVQLPIPETLANLIRANQDLEFILQVRRAEDLLAAHQVSASLPQVSALFDPSGGEGIAPAQWPAAPEGLRLGYAGGIRPDTVVSVLESIAKAGPFTYAPWIDMESGVRTDDRLDMVKVRAILEAAAPYCTYQLR